MANQKIRSDISAGRTVVWPVILVAVLGTAWATAYVYATYTNPIDDPESTYLIAPLLCAAVLLAPFVIWSAIGNSGRALAPDRDGGILVHRGRLIFAIGLPVFALLIWQLGYVISSLIYLPATLWLLGETRAKIVVSVTALILAIVLIGFRWLLNVDLPIAPAWL